MDRLATCQWSINIFLPVAREAGVQLPSSAADNGSSLGVGQTCQSQGGWS